MKVLICGGRDFADMDLVFAAMRDLEAAFGPVTSVIHGGAAGADLLGSRWGHFFGLPVTPFKADWTKHGKAAGPIRNQRMLDEGKPDRVVAFPGGRGTADMVRRAEKAGVPITIIDHGLRMEQA